VSFYMGNVSMGRMGCILHGSSVVQAAQRVWLSGGAGLARLEVLMVVRESFAKRARLYEQRCPEK
jgi:hypothetical protein